jgi:uncharacterized membrane protein
MIVGLAIHTLGAAVWVGGMFFAYMILRPSAGALEPAVRLSLWCRVFSRFFGWVWLSVAALLASGFGMVFLALGGLAAIGFSVRAMMALGLAMVAIFAIVYFAPWPRLRDAVSSADWPVADKNLRRIRFLVGLNLVLGLVTVVVGTSGLPYR